MEIVDAQVHANHRGLDQSVVIMDALGVNAAVIEAKKTGVNPKEGQRALIPDLPTQYEGLDPSKVTIDSLIDHGMCICGSPDSCIKQLERIQQHAQLDQFLAMMQFWPIPHEATMRSIDLWGKHVVPHFENRRPTAAAEATTSPGAR